MNEINNYAGLEYVTIRTSKNSIPAKAMLKVEKDIVRDIIKNRPIRGKELYFLRTQSQISCAKLSVEIKGALDASTISRLERKEDLRLSPTNEMFFRVFFSERFGIKVSASYDSLIPEENELKLEMPA